MEYCRHGDLEELLKKKKRLTEEEAYDLLKQCLKALDYLHSINMWHRDLKPPNILVDNGVYKICDYGLSTVAMTNNLSYQ